MSSFFRARLNAVPPALRPLVLVWVLLTLLVASASVANAARPANRPASGPARPPAGLGLASRLQPVPTWVDLPASVTAPGTPTTPTGPATSTPTPPPTASGTPGQTPGQTPGVPSDPTPTTPVPTTIGAPTAPSPTRTTKPATGHPAGELVTTARHPGRRVVLTFDDGPSPEYTPAVLDLLRRHQVTAVFCVVGVQAREHPDLVRRIAAEGHLLCNHTMTHDMRLPRQPVRVIRDQLRRAHAAIHAAAPGAPIDYYRAPGGNWSPAVQRVTAGMGMKSLGWSVDTRDWQRPGAKAILAAVARELTPGGVVLMHDGGGDRAQTLAALRRLLVTLPAAGYRFDLPA